MLLEMNEYSVQEMNQQEMSEIEGGSFWTWIGAALMVVGSIVFPPAAVIGWAIATTDAVTSEQWV